jgi:hypothetical protein
MYLHAMYLEYPQHFIFSKIEEVREKLRRILLRAYNIKEASGHPLSSIRAPDGRKTLVGIGLISTHQDQSLKTSIVTCVR